MRAFWVLFGAICLALVLAIYSCSEESDDKESKKKGSDADAVDITIVIDGDDRIDKITAHRFALTLEGEDADEASVGVSEGCELLLLQSDGGELAKIATGADISAEAEFVLVRQNHYKLLGCRLVVGDKGVAIALPELDVAAKCSNGQTLFQNPLCGAEISVEFTSLSDEPDKVNSKFMVNVGVGLEGAEDNPKLYVSNDAGETWSKHGEDISWGTEDEASEVEAEIDWNGKNEGSNNLALLISEVGDDEYWVLLRQGMPSSPTFPHELGEGLLALNLVAEAVDNTPLQLAVLNPTVSSSFILDAEACEASDGGGVAPLISWKEGVEPSSVENLRIVGLVPDAEGGVLIPDIYAVAEGSCSLKVFMHNVDGDYMHGNIFINVGAWSDQVAIDSFNITGVEVVSGELVITYQRSGGNISASPLVKVGDEAVVDGTIHGSNDDKIKVSGITELPASGTKVWVKMSFNDAMDTTTKVGDSVDMYEIPSS